MKYLEDQTATQVLCFRLINEKQATIFSTLSHTLYAQIMPTVIAFIYSAAPWSSDSLYRFIHTARQTQKAGSDFRLINGTIWVQQTTRASAEHCLVCRLYAESIHTTPNMTMTLTPRRTRCIASTYMHDESVMMTFFWFLCMCLDQETMNS